MVTCLVGIYTLTCVHYTTPTNIFKQFNHLVVIVLNYTPHRDNDDVEDLPAKYKE